MATHITGFCVHCLRRPVHRGPLTLKFTLPHPRAPEMTTQLASSSFVEHKSGGLVVSECQTNKNCYTG